MHIRMPVGYAIRGTIGRTTRTYRFQEKVDIEIAEATADEAPVAVSWPAHTDMRDYPPLKYGFLGHGGEDGRKLTRWHNGRHWLRLTEADALHSKGVGRYAELTETRFLDALSHGGGHMALGLNALSPGDHRKVDADPTDRFVDINRSGREEALTSLRSSAHNILAVDGVLHAACAQPAVCLALARDDSTETQVVHVDTRSNVVDGKDYLLTQTLVFGLHEWDEISDIAVRGSRDRHRTAQRLDALRPTVHLHETIDPDILTERTADTYVRRFILDSYPRMVRMHHYFELTDGMAREEYLRGMLADHRHIWESQGLPVQLLELADEAFADARVDFGAELSLPKPFG